MKEKYLKKTRYQKGEIVNEDNIDMIGYQEGRELRGEDIEKKGC